MGMYTELDYHVRLIENVPQDVLDILNYMTTLDKDAITDRNRLTLPNHPLFSTDRWHFMLLCGSYYFKAKTHSELRFDTIINQYYLDIRCNLKNYDDEIEKFCNWIEQYVEADEGDFLGFSRYEETRTPTLIYMTKTNPS